MNCSVWNASNKHVGVARVSLLNEVLPDISSSTDVTES